MSKQAARSKRSSRNPRVEGNVVSLTGDHFVEARTPQHIECKTSNQSAYLTSMKSNKLTFGIGPAGTGKTFLAISLAAQQLLQKDVSRIIVTRPLVEAKGAGGGLGFLPGTVEQKVDPYFVPLRQVLRTWFGDSHLELLLKRKTIEYVPMEHLRGMTFDNCFIILDEAQNSTPKQMKLFLTRIGQYSTVVVNGDNDQQDINGVSGLDDAVNRLQGMADFGSVTFTEEDIVRSGLVREILKRYRTS